MAPPSDLHKQPAPEGLGTGPASTAPAPPLWQRTRGPTGGLGSAATQATCTDDELTRVSPTAPLTTKGRGPQVLRSQHCRPPQRGIGTRHTARRQPAPQQGLAV